MLIIFQIFGYGSGWKVIQDGKTAEFGFQDQCMGEKKLKFAFSPRTTDKPFGRKGLANDRIPFKLCKGIFTTEGPVEQASFVLPCSVNQERLVCVVALLGV